MSSHMSSQQVKAMAQYFASTEDLEIVCCFLDFQEINEPPMKMQKPVMDLQVSTHPAQSESKSAGKNRPCVGEFLTYLKTFVAACKCDCLGLNINWLRICTKYVISGLVMVR
jgi:hypothetical protein